MNLYFLTYNNYYNRIVKRENTLDEYLEKSTHSDSWTNQNFIVNDGVSTEHIVNNTEADMARYDYLVVTPNDSDEIVSRWFVIDSVKNRLNQYIISLKRDTIAENYDKILTSDMFIEKGTVSQDNDLIFNSENMSFSQIKTSETLLKDKTGTPWIVGYCASYDGEGHVPDLSGTTVESTVADINMSDTNMTQWEYYDFVTRPRTVLTRVQAMYLYWHYIFENREYITYNNLLYSNSQYVTSDTTDYDGRKGYFVAASYVSAAQNTQFYTWFNFDELAKQYASYKGYYQVDPADLEILDGKTIMFKDGIYKIRVNTGSKYESTEAVNDSGSFYNYLTGIAQEKWKQQVGMDVSTHNNPMYAVRYNHAQYSINLTPAPVDRAGINYSIPITRAKLSDAPYDMFAIPFNDVIVTNGSSSFDADGSVSFSIAMDIARKFSGAGVLYDIQLLPYCPVYNAMTGGSGEINITELEENSDYTYITDNETDIKISIILFPRNSSFNTTIKLSKPVVIEDYKVESETDVYRLCSPNYSGVFEFNAAKNGGISYFNVNCTYIPFNPYIRVAPNFGRLYKQDFNDNRGLLCGGDFSLPIVSDAWETYQLQNKNYQASFDRQISNMEVNNSVQRERELWSMGTGIVTAGIQGATSGALIGGGVGAAIGGILGAATSAIGGSQDLRLNDKLRNESIDYTKDQFGYQLGNIKALPIALSKTTAYTINNKIFPFLEYYTCSEDEKNALKNKLKYNGMTIMVVGKLQDYIDQGKQQYVKGQLIRFDTSERDMDFHEVNDLANELNKGVFW